MNLQSNVVKGAIMLLLTSILTLVTNYPETSTGWLIFGITTAGTLLIYFAQSALFPANSESGQINGKDVLKALLVAGGNALSTFGAEISQGQPVAWKGLILSMIGLFAAYLIKQWQTPAPKA